MGGPMRSGRVRRRARALVGQAEPATTGLDRRSDRVSRAGRRVVDRLGSRGRAVHERWGRPGQDEGDHANLLEAVARSLRSGQSMSRSLREAAVGEVDRPPGRALAHSVRLADAGVAVVAVVDDWVGAAPTRPRVMAGTALALGAELGGAQARCLDAAAASLRERASLEREVRALTSQARASAGVMVLAPLGFAVFSSATNPRVATVLTATPLGWGCLVGGLALDGAGAAWMARLSRRVR